MSLAYFLERHVNSYYEVRHSRGAGIVFQQKQREDFI